MMQSALYVALSAQLALDRRLTNIANNVANAGTVGFRGQGNYFEALVQQDAPNPASFASLGREFVDERGGGLARTGNPLDVAVLGEGYLAIQTPAGTAYTRDGRMQVLPGGELVTLAGHPVLDAGDSPIVLDPAAGPVDIGRDGMITQRGKRTAAIGLFNVDLGVPFQRYENSALLPSKPGLPIVTFQSDGIVQGFVENSNVNPISEMAKLISVTRAFEGAAAGIDDSSAMLKEAIQSLASRA